MNGVKDMWYLESLISEDKVFMYEAFDAAQIKSDIKEYLDYCTKDELYLYKECNNKKTVGDTLIDVFVSKNGNICKVVTKGNREFFKKLS